MIIIFIFVCVFSYLHFRKFFSFIFPLLTGFFNRFYLSSLRIFFHIIVFSFFFLSYDLYFSFHKIILVKFHTFSRAVFCFLLSFFSMYNIYLSNNCLFYFLLSFFSMHNIYLSNDCLFYFHPLKIISILFFSYSI